MAPIRGRVLSANSPGVLALSQGRADLFALRPPWRPFAATRPQIYADGRRGGACRRAARTVLFCERVLSLNSPDVLPPHRLGGAHKRGAPYSSRRALLPKPKSLEVDRATCATRSTYDGSGARSYPTLNLSYEAKMGTISV